MDVDTFKELLKKEKLLDAYNRPLRLLKHPDEEAQSDSFFRCISLAMHGSEAARIHLRAACVLRFIRIFFYRMDHVRSVHEFLHDEVEGARVSRVAYREEAIQAWLYKHTTFRETSSQTLFSTQQARLKADAVAFIRQNNQVGMLTCRFTFGYLLASLYPVQIHLYDQLRDGGHIHVQPAINIEGPRRGSPPAAEKEGDERDERELHIYMWYNAHTFQLLVPKRPAVTHQSRAAVLRALHMKKQRFRYELRKSLHERTNVGVCKLRPLRGDPEIHSCTLSPAQLQEDPEAVYMLFPCDGQVQLEIPQEQHLFVYCVRESETDVRPRIECLVELTHDIAYPFFLLPDDTRHLIVTVSALMRDDVLRKIGPHFLK